MSYFTSIKGTFIDFLRPVRALQLFVFKIWFLGNICSLPPHWHRPPPGKRLKSFHYEMTALNYVTCIILSTNLIQLSSLWSYLKVHSLIFHNQILVLLSVSSFHRCKFEISIEIVKLFGCATILQLPISCCASFYGITIIKGALDKYSIIPQLFQKKVGIFVSLEVLAWVMTAYWVSHSRLTYFWSNMNISSIFYFSKSTSINTQYSSLWDTLKMMLFTKYLIKWKRIGRISWKFRYWFTK